MGTVTSTVRAWATPRPACTCELCWPPDEPEGTVTSRPPERAPDPRSVRAAQACEDSAEAVFGCAPWVY